VAGAVKPIPDGYHGAIPYLICKGAARAMEFYKRAFGATEVMRMDGPGGIVAHAELRIGEALFMLADESPAMGARSPQSLGGTPVSIYIYVTDVDALARRASEVGAKVIRPVADQFYGDRSVILEDPFGHKWGFATHIEDVSLEEMTRRAASKQGSCGDH
jgi:PhnB protein